MVSMKSGLNLKEILSALQKDITLFTSKDLSTCLRRLESEKISFLTKTLPLLGKALEQGLEMRQFICPTNFSRYKGTALPKLFRGLLNRIFDENGFLLLSPCTSSVRDLRQICYFFNKVKTKPSLLQRAEAIKKFLTIEEENRHYDNVGSEQLSVTAKEILARASVMAHMLFRDLSLKDIVPSDGPGAVADKRTQKDRVQFNVIYGDIHGKYPYYDYYHYSSSDLLNRVNSYFSAKKLEFGASRFCLVPKDSRGPRIITIEPAEYQYIQQGQRVKFVDHLEQHPLTRGFVNFSDQSINNRLALESSISRYYDTIDLSDASDRVTAKLVEQVLPQHIVEYLFASRTKDVVIPKSVSGLDEDIKIAVHKFAGMGSAMCFPVEACIFFLLAYSSIQVLCPKDTIQKPYVYGDDIIIPHGLKDSLVEVFREFGLAVNAQKSFSKGFFRESCGGDYFYGENVTPIRLRVQGEDKADSISLIETCNQLHRAMLWNTEEVLHKHIESQGITVYSHEHTYPSTLTQYFSKSTGELHHSSTPGIISAIPSLVFGKLKTRWSTVYQKWQHPCFTYNVKTTKADSSWKGVYLRWSAKTVNTERSAFEFSKKEQKVSHKYI